MTNDEKIMEELIDYAFAKMEMNNAYPFCAFVVKNGVIVSKGYNSSVNNYGDKTKHGEMEAFSKAVNSLKPKNLIFGNEFSLFTTCEPCLACFDTALWHKIGKIVYSVDHNNFPEYFHDHPYAIDDFQTENPDFIAVEKDVLKEKGAELFKYAKEKYGW